MKPRVPLPRTPAERRAAIVSAVLLAISLAVVGAIVFPVARPWGTQTPALTASSGHHAGKRLPRRPLRHVARTTPPALGEPGGSVSSAASSTTLGAVMPATPVSLTPGR